MTTRPRPCSRCRGLEKHFPITKGLLQRKVGAVRAVDGIDLRRATRARRWAWSASRAAASRPPAGCSPGCSSRPVARSIFEGQDISHLSQGQMRPLRRDIQMIFQDPFSSLNPRHTVGLDRRGAAADPEQSRREHGIKRAVQDLLELVGLSPEHYNRYPHEFSGGQRQRIGIARALALRPKMIIADEPVSALDVSIQAQVVNLLDDLQREFDLTYVFIAHDLSVVRHISDRVAVMYLGKVVEIADRRRALQQPAPPVHGRADVRGAGARPGPPRPRPARAGAAHRRRAEPDQPAVRLPVPHPLLEGAGHLRDRGAAAGHPPGRPGVAPDRLPLPGHRRGVEVPSAATSARASRAESPSPVAAVSLPGG